MSSIIHPVVGVIRSCISRSSTRLDIQGSTELTRIGLDSLEIIGVFVALEAELGIPVDRLATVLHEGPVTIQSLTEVYDETLRERTN